MVLVTISSVSLATFYFTIVDKNNFL